MGENYNSCFFLSLKFQGPMAVIEWSMKQGLIASRYSCPKCSQGMILTQRHAISGGFEWTCQKKDHSIKCSVRKGSWFQKSKLSIIETLLLTYYWLFNFSSEFIQKEMSLSDSTVTEWISYCREVCVEFLLDDNSMIGGVGKIVEIDESKLEKRNYNTNKSVKGHWVFGGVERGTKNCFFRVVEKRDKETLFRVLRESIRPGTTIVSNCWEAYGSLQDEGFKHLTVNHSLHFKDPKTDPNIKQATWSAIKGKINNKSRNLNFNVYLYEYCWKRKISQEPQPIIKFIEAIKLKFSPDEKDTKRSASTFDLPIKDRLRKRPKKVISSDDNSGVETPQQDIPLQKKPKFSVSLPNPLPLHQEFDESESSSTSIRLNMGHDQHSEDHRESAGDKNKTQTQLYTSKSDYRKYGEGHGDTLPPDEGHL